MTTRSIAGAMRPCSRFHLLRTAPAAVALALAWGLPGNAAAAEMPDEPESELEEVTVTGSRIANVTGMDTPTPVAALSADEIQAMAPTSLTAALVQLPQFYNSTTAETFGNAGTFGFLNSSGGGNLNLRGLNTKRTLTLLDGRRMVPASAYGGPDINLFPAQMLRRVEAVTGGASAAYGTDAVAGVVNFILDTRFEGTRFSAQTGFSDLGDARNQQYNMELGHRLGDKSHLLFSAGYMTQDAVVGFEGRDWYQGCGLIADQSALPVGVTRGQSPEFPVNVPACNLHNTGATYDGMFTFGAGPAARTYELLESGEAIPFVRTTPGAVQPGGGGQNSSFRDQQLTGAQNRKNVFAYLDHDFTDNLNVYVQGVAAWQTLTSYLRSGDILGGPQQQMTIFRNNAFLPDSVAAIMDNAGVTSVTFTRNGLAGSQTNQNISQTRSATLGFKSTIAADGFFNGWAVEGYGQYGKNNLDAAQNGALRMDRVYLAADAVRDPVTGAIRCNVTVTSGNMPDCVPLNVFGRGNTSDAALDWIKGYDPGQYITVNPFIGYDENNQPIYGDPYSYISDDAKHRLVETTQKVFEISASGELFEGFGAGAIHGAFGAHWREEAIDQKINMGGSNNAADPTYFPVWCNDGDSSPGCQAQIAAGIRPAGNIGVRGVSPNAFRNTIDLQFSNVPFIKGSFTVKELFGETLVPVIADAPWMRELNFSGAIRWADYGGSGTIWSWKGGLNATFTSEWRLRGTYSRDTRAANVAERFDRSGGVTGGLTDFVDPLPTGWVNGQTAAITVNGGNPEVNPEKADTFTVGLVYRPEWLDGFSASVDWLKVKLKGAIETLPAQRVIDLCAAGDQDQCARITRDATTNRILFIPQTYQNLNKVTQESLDVELAYRRPIQIFGGNERLGLRLFSTTLLENSLTNSTGLKTDSVGDVGQQLFKRKANLSVDYSNGPFGWNIQARYIGKARLSTNFNIYRTDFMGGAVRYDVASNEVASVTYFDTQLRYDVSLADGSNTMQLFANVNNLLDREPPRVYALNSNAQINGAYSNLGRTFVLGVKLSL